MVVLKILTIILKLVGKNYVLWYQEFWYSDTVYKLGAVILRMLMVTLEIACKNHVL